MRTVAVVVVTNDVPKSKRIRKRASEVSRAVIIFQGASGAVGGGGPAIGVQRGAPRIPQLRLDVRRLPANASRDLEGFDLRESAPVVGGALREDSNLRRRDRRKRYGAPH